MDRTPATAFPTALPRRESLLIVDDEDHIRFALSLTLRKAGFQVDTVRNGIEALDLIRRRHGGPDAFALLIIDLRMPLMGGARLLSVLDADGIRIPAIGITGCMEQDAAEQLLQAGCLHVLSKPFPADEFLARVEEAVAHRPVIAVGDDRRRVVP